MKNSSIDSIREFNRYYTDVIGLLDQHILDSPFSLAEARIIYELSHQPNCTASDLMIRLKMDKGQLSRILETFRRRGLTARKKSKLDGRAAHLSLTGKGQSEFEKLNQASNDQIGLLIKKISTDDQNRLLNHMTEIIKILNQSL